MNLSPKDLMYLKKLSNQMTNFDFKPGSLVTLRNRPWMVLPSEDTELLLIKPLGGTDDEITGIFKPLANEADKPQTYNFIKPSEKDFCQTTIQCFPSFVPQCSWSFSLFG
jgi:hypothetical protein